jgi:hypothetical protein
MFLKSKNKFRFVTVSFLLASLVTVISSASADTEDLVFEFTVESCGVPADWTPSINSYLVNDVLSGVDGPIYFTAKPGATVEMEIGLYWTDGFVDCDSPQSPTGNVTGVFKGLPAGFFNDESFTIVSETVFAGASTINDYFDIPSEALAETVTGSYELTWTPE